MNGSGELPRKIGFWGGSAIMVGIIIGSGIFLTPASIAREMGHPLLILLLWLAGGLLSLFGALTYAELGTLFPRSGGLYVFLNQSFGGGVAFIFGWSYMLLAKPFAAAAISIGTALYLNRLLGVDWPPPVTACVILILLTGLNTLDVRAGAGTAVVMTGLKVISFAGLVGLGLILSRGSWQNLAAVEAPKPFLTAVAPVMYAVLWTYDGWSDVASVAGEVRNPHTMLPRILLAGTAATIAIYLAVNTIYLTLIPLPEMRAVEEVGPLAMERLLGPTGATVMAGMIVLSTLGASHGSILTGARVTFAQARDGLLFRFLGHVHPRFQTPYVSLWVQAALSCVAVILLPRFNDLAQGYGFTMWIFYGLAAAGMIRLRLRRPDLERPYRCWGYPVVPVLFIGAALGMTILAIAQNPRTTLPWLGIAILGVPAYLLWKHGVRR